MTGPDVNPAYSIIPGGDLNPSNILSNNQGGSIPNLSGSNAGYTSTPSGLAISSRLRSRGTVNQGPELERMHQAIIAEFSDIKQQVLAWQNIINRPTVIRQEEIERIYNVFTTRIDDLTNRCIIGRIDFKIHSEIIQLVPIIKRARKAHLNRIGILIDETRRNGVEEDEDNAFLEDDLFADPTIDRPPLPEAPSKGEKQKTSHPSVDGIHNETYQNEEQFAENIRFLKSKQKDLIAEAARIPLPSQGDDEQSFHGFNTVFDEIEAIKSLIENNKRTHDAKVWKIEKKVSNSSINIKKIEETIDELNTNIQDVLCMVEVNSTRISAVEEKSYNLALSMKAMENRISRRFQNIEERLGMSKVSPPPSYKVNGSTITHPSEGNEI